MNLLLAALLFGHALIHVSYITPAPPQTATGPSWPFRLTGSWLLNLLRMDAGAATALGRTLVSATVFALTLASLAMAGLLPAAWWPLLVATGSVLSMATLVTFFHPWLVLGLVIDAALLWGTLVAGWAP